MFGSSCFSSMSCTSSSNSQSTSSSRITADIPGQLFVFILNSSLCVCWWVGNCICIDGDTHNHTTFSCCSHQDISATTSALASSSQTKGRYWYYWVLIQFRLEVSMLISGVSSLLRSHISCTGWPLWPGFEQHKWRLPACHQGRISHRDCCHLHTDVWAIIERTGRQT